MKLLTIEHSDHFSGAERRLDFAKGDGQPHLTVAITGGAGSGKTALLELIARHKEHVAPYGRPTATRDVLVGTAARLEVRTEWLLEDSEQRETGSSEAKLTATSVWEKNKAHAHADPALAHVLARYRHGPEWGKIDYMPTDRAAAPGVGAPGDPLMWQKQQRLDLTGAKYAGLGRLFLGANPSAQEEMNNLLEALCPGLRALVDQSALRFETSRGRRSLPELSLSQRLSFQLAATFSLIGLHHSVVFIDTPELGFPCGDAARVLAVLHDFAPTTQLVVATTDSGILSSQHTAVIQLEDA